MLSFYEFNCLIEKNTKVYSEAGRASVEEMLAKLKAKKAQQAQLGGNAPQQVAQTEAPPPPVKKPVPRPPAAAAEAPAEEPAAAQQVPPPPISSGKKRIRSQANIVRGQTAPAKVTPGHDIHDPESEEMQALKAGEKGRLRGFRGTSRLLGPVASNKSADISAANKTDHLMMLNQMAMGHIAGNLVTGKTRVANHAGAVQDAIEKVMGVEFMRGHPKGEPFEVAANVSRGKESFGLPEFIVPSRKIPAIMAAYNKASPRGQSGNIAEMPDFKKAIKLDADNAFAANDGSYDYIKRAQEFEPFLFKDNAPKRNKNQPDIESMFTGKMKIKQLAHALAKLTPDKSAPSDLLAARARNEQAVSYLVKKSIDGGYPFFKAEGDPQDRETVVEVVPSSEAIAASQAANNPTMDFKAWSQGAHESVQWGALCDVMEHWGF